MCENVGANQSMQREITKEEAFWMGVAYATFNDVDNEDKAVEILTNLAPVAIELFMGYKKLMEDADYDIYHDLLFDIGMITAEDECKYYSIINGAMVVTEDTLDEEEAEKDSDVETINGKDNSIFNWVCPVCGEENTEVLDEDEVYEGVECMECEGAFSIAEVK